MGPRRERLEFFFRGRVLRHVITMPSKRKIMIQRVDQQIKQFWSGTGRGGTISK